MTLDMDSPDMDDELMVICRTSDNRVLSRQFFNVKDVAVMDDLKQQRYRLNVEFSVPYCASRLAVRPRQSEGFVAFRSLHIEDPAG